MRRKKIRLLVKLDALEGAIMAELREFPFSFLKCGGGSDGRGN